MRMLKYTIYMEALTCIHFVLVTSFCSIACSEGGIRDVDWGIYSLLFVTCDGER